MKNTITKLKTNTMDAADIIRSMLNAYDGAWHTYEDELINMYLDEDTTAVLSLRTGVMTIHEWSERNPSMPHVMCAPYGGKHEVTN